MSRENVELVRRLYEAFETRDNVLPFEVYDPEIEWYPGAVDGVGFEPVYRGHDGVRAYCHYWLESWESIEFRLDDLIDAGDEVVALIWQCNRGRASGAAVEYEYAQVWTLRDGLVTRQRIFVRQQDALKAVGLSKGAISDESMTPDLVELTRRFVEAWNRRDVDAWMGFFAHDAVWEVPALDASVEGAAAIRSFGEEWFVAFAEYEVQLEEIRDLGNGVVFAATRQVVRPAGSGGDALLQEVWVYAFVWVEGVLVRSTIYRDPDEGRAAAERLAESRR